MHFHRDKAGRRLRHRVGTTRGHCPGLHLPIPALIRVKLVRCTTGALWDVIVDLRQIPPTYLRHIGVELTARNRRALYDRIVDRPG